MCQRSGPGEHPGQGHLAENLAVMSGMRPSTARRGKTPPETTGIGRRPRDCRGNNEDARPLSHQQAGRDNPSNAVEGITMTTVSRSTDSHQLTRDIAAVVADLIQRYDLTVRSFAPIIGLPRVTLQRKLDGICPFDMDDFGALLKLGWVPSKIVAAAERGALYPTPRAAMTSDEAVATWLADTWATSHKFADGSYYAERTAGAGEAAVTLTRGFDLVLDGGVFTVQRQQEVLVHIAGTTIDLDAARSMLAARARGPATAALAALVDAYDEATLVSGQGLAEIEPEKSSLIPA